MAKPCADGCGAVRILQVHELAPVELGVLQESRFFAPLRVIVPEFFAHVGEFDPGVDKHAVAVAGFDEPVEVFIAFGIGIVEMPGGDMERADTGLTPAFGEIVGISAHAVGIVEKGPEVRGAHGGFKAEAGKGLHEVGEAFVARRTWIEGDPKDGSFADAHACDERGCGPPVFREDASGRGDVITREADGLVPDDGQRGVVDVCQMNDGNGFAARTESEAGGERG